MSCPRPCCRVAALYPRSLPDLPVRPEQYATESAPRYVERVYRWRQWLDHDQNRALLGGPMQWFATANEVRAYEAWRDQTVTTVQDQELPR